jgi:hypothetical protein
MDNAVSASEPMSESAAAISSHEERVARPRRLTFSNPQEREAHLQAFLTWLPAVLKEAPGIAWDRLPSSVMGHLIRIVATTPDAIPIAFAMGCAMHAVKASSLHAYCSGLTILLRRLRHQYGLSELAQLHARHIWDQFVAGRMVSAGELRFLGVYDALASLHVRAYLDGLTERERVVWKPYALPPLPAGFVETHGKGQAVRTATMQRRKEQSDVLLPLFPLLVELAQLRKQAAERLIKAFRQQRDRLLAGELALPHHFAYTDRQLTLTDGASTLAEVQLIEQEISLSFTLWDRVSWVREHPDRYCRAVRSSAKNHRLAYAPEHTLYFLQFHGKPEQLLWCGDIIRDGRFGHTPAGASSPLYFSVPRIGLLTPSRSDTQWFFFAWRPGEMLFEPESLYRGVLYAAALASLALTNGSRVSELLQISADRFETLVVDELKDQQPTGRKIGILVQKLLPKGFRQESERQFFLIGEMAARLLREIGQLLETTHGGTIPIVHPYGNSKIEDLHPEPYLFQWNASADGRLGMLGDEDVRSLLRFLFHGLALTTRTGTPIRVAPHLLRHVLATHARQVEKVPAEAVAYLLHHRVLLADSSRAVTISEATAYYSRMTMEQLLALLFEAQSALTTKRGRSYLQVPSPRTLEQMDEALRAVFEQWGMIGPTVLGYCSAGLCIRPNQRALCLNCPHLVPHYSNLRNARTWRKFHVLQAQLHDAHGHSIDAQQARDMVRYLDDTINVMQIQIRTRQDGGYLPFADTLLPALDEEGEVP